MAKIADRTVTPAIEQTLTPLPPDQQGRLNIPVPDFGTSFSSSPGNPSPNRSILPLNITPDMYLQQYFPDAAHFERSFPISTVTAQYSAAQALTMQAASVSSPIPKIQPQNLDQLPDGDVHASPLQTALSGGKVDLGKPGVINKTLANILDDAGTTRYAVASIDAARKALVDFSQSHTNKNLDNVPNGTRSAWDSGTQKTAAVDASGNILLKNVAVVNGSTSGPVLTGDGTYQTVTDLSVARTTKGNQVYLSFATGFSATDGFLAYMVYFALFCDAARVSPEYGIEASDSIQYTATGIYIDSPTAASHTFTVKCKTAAGVLVTLVGTQRSLSVIELG
jgi:hypothetical protein